MEAAPVYASLARKERSVECASPRRSDCPDLAVESEGATSPQEEAAEGGTVWERRRRWILSECSGALGDVGSFLPIVTALASSGQINITAVLFYSGLYNVLTGLAFGVPLPVQPMHTISAVAIVESLSSSEISAAGIVIGVIVGALGVSGLISFFTRLVPRDIVRGIQLALGLRLMSKGLGPDYAWRKVSHGGGGGDESTLWWGYDSVLTALLCGLLTLWVWGKKQQKQQQQQQQQQQCLDNQRYLHPSSGEGGSCQALGGRVLVRERKEGRDCAPIPVALLLFMLGMVLSLLNTRGADDQSEASASAEKLRALWSSSEHFLPGPTIPSRRDFVTGTMQAALPQLPLTCLNSVLAVTSLVKELYPSSSSGQGRRAANARLLALSIGGFNAACCGFGHFPSCHGAGGLAAQHAFGARGGTSMVLLGLFKVLFAVAFGAALLPVLESFPRSILGVLLCVSGLELAIVSLRETVAPVIHGVQRDYTLLLLTAAACLVYNTGLGFVGGGLAAVVLRLAAAKRDARSSSSGSEGPREGPEDERGRASSFPGQLHAN